MVLCRVPCRVPVLALRLPVKWPNDSKAPGVLLRWNSFKVDKFITVCCHGHAQLGVSTLRVPSYMKWEKEIEKEEETGRKGYNEMQRGF